MSELARRQVWIGPMYWSLNKPYGCVWIGPMSKTACLNKPYVGVWIDPTSKLKCLNKPYFVSDLALRRVWISPTNIYLQYCNEQIGRCIWFSKSDWGLLHLKTLNFKVSLDFNNLLKSLQKSIKIYRHYEVNLTDSYNLMKL